MQPIPFGPAVLLSLFLFAACSTAGQNAVTRGAPCTTLAEFADNGHGAILACLDTDQGRVWSIPGIDQPITAKATENAPCSRVGTLAAASDGSVMRCTWDNSDLPSNGAAGRP